MPADPSIVAYLRQRAAALGIDPSIAERVAAAEALNVFDPNRPDLGGDDRSSFGVYQLHYGGLSPKMPHAGLGDEFTKATGLDARDPRTWKQQIDFSLDFARKHGWGSWMGAKNTGIPNFAGIPGGSGAAPVAGATAAAPNLAMQFGQAAATGAGKGIGDVTAQQGVQGAMSPPGLPSLALTFLQQAEDRRQREDEQDQARRQALFAPTVAVAPGSLAGLYG